MTILKEDVATVPTVYGIETLLKTLCSTTSKRAMLQQYLPFTVLKLSAYPNIQILCR